MWDSATVPKAILDEDFNLSDEKSQQFLLDFCQDLRKQDFVLDKDVRCWIESFNLFVKSQVSKTLPIKSEEFD